MGPSPKEIQRRKAVRKRINAQLKRLGWSCSYAITRLIPGGFTTRATTTRLEKMADQLEALGHDHP